MNFTYYVNGKWLNAEKSLIPFNDAGFLLGDGLFETIRFQNRNLFKPENHLSRLRSGLNLIKINLKQSNKNLTELLIQIIKINKLKSGLLRLMITRGKLKGEPWNYKGPPCIYISIRPISLESTELPVKVVFFKEKNYPIIRFKPAIKSMNYIGNMLAKKDAELQGAFEPVFINSDGFITECAIRNIFFFKDQTLITPTTELGILPGVMRDTIIEIANESNIKTVKSKINQNELNDMEEAFISSSGIGLIPCYWDGWDSNFKQTLKLKEKLFLMINQ